MFFQDLRRLADNVKTLNADLFLIEIFKEEKFQRYILDLNRREQLFQGINSLGVSLDSYAPFTEELNKERTFTFQGESKQKITGEPVFLFDTGEFYDSFRLNILDDGFEIEADTIKDGDDDLAMIYGLDILGLTEEHTQFVIDAITEKILPAIIEYLQD